MAIRYRKDRDKFEVAITLRGKRIRRLFDTKKAAQEFNRDVNLRKVNLTGLELPITIEEAFKSFIQTESAQKAPRSRNADKRYFFITRWFFENERRVSMADEVTFEDLQLFQLWASKPQKCGDVSKDTWDDTTISRCAKLLKQVFRKLERMGRVKKNPAEFWKVPCGTSGRRRPMTESEFQALHLAAATWFKPILQFMRLTGARGASVAGLLWSDIDFNAKRIILRSRKGGLKKTKEIILPLYDDLYWFLISIRNLVVLDNLDHPVFFNQARFPITADTISAYGHTLIKQCGFEGLVLYGLRHAIAVDMTKAGISLETTRQGMGHSNISQTSDYARGIGLDSVAEAFNQIRPSKSEKKPPPDDTKV